MIDRLMPETSRAMSQELGLQRGPIPASRISRERPFEPE